MNKRQAKKQFKKKYGYNPQKVVYTLNSINWEEVNETINRDFSWFAEEFKRQMEFANNQLREYANYLNKESEENK